MLFLKLGDYEGVMTMLDRTEEINEDKKIFMRVLVTSDPRSPYFSASDVRVYADTLTNLFPDSPYAVQASVVAGLMEKYAQSAAEAEQLSVKLSELNDNLTGKDMENNSLKEAAEEYQHINSELRKENERLSAQERRLRRELTDMRARLEAIKEIDLQIKQSREGGRE
ncbi:hypothetical protein EP073_03975 [Geovibrio thiophilus]|uniref:Uncharacterized protein n=1 Tax=Geovibrio thiophilus TaxID=139438 RepID=A0A410JWL8_9BACT|nr:hypothetical protein [Geovibrio thiophilus]QAR32592.1 hypothetical protein EP073_03975 [Geovibrio thiophilus]